MLQYIEKEPDKLKEIEATLSVFRELVNDLNVGLIDFEYNLLERVFAEVLMALSVFELDNFLYHD